MALGVRGGSSGCVTNLSLGCLRSGHAGLGYDNRTIFAHFSGEDAGGAVAVIANSGVVTLGSCRQGRCGIVRIAHGSGGDCHLVYQAVGVTGCHHCVGVTGLQQFSKNADLDAEGAVHDFRSRHIVGCQSITGDVAVCVQAEDRNLHAISDGLVGETGAVEGQNVVLIVRVQGSVLGGEGCILGCRGRLRSGGLVSLGGLSLGGFRSRSFFLGSLSLGSLGCRGLVSLRGLRCRGYGSGSLVSLGSLRLGSFRGGGLFGLRSFGRSGIGDLEGGESHKLLIGLTLRVADSNQSVGCACGQLACLNSEGGLEGAVLNLICRHRDGSDSIAGDLLVCIQCVDADLNAGANLLTVEAGANNVHGVELRVTGEVSILNNDGGISLLCLGSRGGGGGRLRGCRSGGLGGCRSSGGRGLCLGGLCLGGLGCVSLGSLSSVSLRSFGLGCFNLRCLGCRSGGGRGFSLRSFGCLSLRSLSLGGFSLRSLSLRSLGCLSLGGFSLRSLGCLSLGGLGCVAARQGRSLSSCLLVDNLLLVSGCFCRESCRDCCHGTSSKGCRCCDLVNATGSLRHFSSISELSVLNLPWCAPVFEGAVGPYMGVTAKRLAFAPGCLARLPSPLHNCNEIVIKTPLKLRFNADQFGDFAPI